MAPLWRDGNEQEEKWLVACYLRSLELAAKYHCRKVAIPVICNGISDFPFGKALQIAYDTCQYCLTEKQMALDILLVLYVWDLRYNEQSKRAAAMFNIVAEYVNTNHQLEEEKIEMLRLAEGEKQNIPGKL